MKPGRVAALVLFTVGTLSARAQSSLEMLQRDLDEMKAEHQEMTAKNFSNFLGALQAAAQSPDAAEKLYLQAGGSLPKAADVRTEYEHETPTEQSARLAIDQSEQTSFGGMLQLHCALMRYAALFAVQPSMAGLDDSWLTWLKTAGQLYPQVAVPVIDTRAEADATDSSARRARHHPPDAGPQYRGEDPVAQIKNLKVRTSLISSYLGFNGWKKGDEGTWSVSELPGFYRSQILEPLRKTPTADTLAAWDVYMAMMNADQPDAKEWADVDYPALLFDKDCDDFASAPDTDKLQTLIGIIKAHPDHPLQDEWLARMHTLVQDYRAQRIGSASAAAAPIQSPVQTDSTNDAPITATTVTPPATNSAPVR